MELGFPLCGGGAPFVCAVPAGCGLCDENLELMLEIQEFLLGFILFPGSGEIGGASLSPLERLSNPGLLGGVFERLGDWCENGIGVVFECTGIGLGGVT